MLPMIHNLLLSERKIAYILTDRDSKVLEVNGMVDFLLGEGQSCLGCRLPDICPELVGNEEALFQILNGELTRLELVRINRETPSGHTLYLDMTTLPYQSETGEIVGLLHFVQDMTKMGDL